MGTHVDVARKKCRLPGVRTFVACVATLGIGVLHLGLTPASANDVVVPRMGTFTQTGSMIQPRFDAEAIRLKDGRVLVMGGATALRSPGVYYANYTTSAEIYDPSTGKFSVTGSMKNVRVHPEVVLLGSGKVLVMGGQFPDYGGSPDTVIKTGEVYDPSTGQFTQTNVANGRYLAPRAVALANGKALVVGDHPTYVTKEVFEIFDPETGNFSETGGSPRVGRGSELTLLPSGKVLMTGGRNFSEQCSEGTYWLESELFDPLTGTISKTGNLLGPRLGGASYVRPDGKVVILGGNVPNGGGCNNLDPSTQAEIYDPETGLFSDGGRSYLVGDPWVILDGDRVLLNLGEDRTYSEEDGPDLYGTMMSIPIQLKPITNEETYSFTGQMKALHSEGIAVKLSDGTVLIAGGGPQENHESSVPSSFSGIAEIFDPDLAPPPLPEKDFTRIGIVKVSPAKKSIRRGKTGSIVLTFTNIGDQYLSSNKVCGTVRAKDSRHLRLAGKCQKEDPIGPGKTGKVKFKVVVKKKAKKGKVIPVKFVLATEDFDEGTPITKSATARIKIK